MVMNNEVEFIALAHSLLLKSGASSEDRQTHKSKIASIQTSSQAARKKRFTRLDLERCQPLNATTLSTVPNTHGLDKEKQEDPLQRSNQQQGSFGISAALNQPPHD
jgi:hypothetical protein